MMSDSRYSYGGRCPGCNHVIALTVDAPEYRDDVAATIAEWVRDGLIVERFTVDEARNLFDICACNQRTETLPLFSIGGA